MKSTNPAFRYQQAAASGATPLGQVVALYDTILRNLGRAAAALQGGDVETQVAELNHALLVIAHLQSVLNHERGGEAAKQFAQFYNMTRGMIVQANIEASVTALQRLITLYSKLRQAWAQVEKSSPQGRTGEIPPVASGRKANGGARTAQPDEEEPPLRWSA